jgi:hypothetical protein
MYHHYGSFSLNGICSIQPAKKGYNSKHHPTNKSQSLTKKFKVKMKKEKPSPHSRIYQKSSAFLKIGS